MTRAARHRAEKGAESREFTAKKISRLKKICLRRQRAEERKSQGSSSGAPPKIAEGDLKKSIERRDVKLLTHSQRPEASILSMHMT